MSTETEVTPHDAWVIEIGQGVVDGSLRLWTTKDGKPYRRTREDAMKIFYPLKKDLQKAVLEGEVLRLGYVSELA